MVQMSPLSSLHTTVCHLLPAASNVSYDVSKRPHFHLRPTACEIKIYTGSQSLNPLLFCEMFFFIIVLLEVTDKIICHVFQCLKLRILSLLMQVCAIFIKATYFSICIL